MTLKGQPQAGEGFTRYNQEGQFGQQSYNQTGQETPYANPQYMYAQQPYRQEAPYAQQPYSQNPAGQGGQYQPQAPITTGTSYSFERAERISMSRAYGEMAIGLLVTALVSYFSYASGLLTRFLMATGIFGWIGLAVVQIAFALILSARVMRMQTSTARVMFYLYAALMGFTLSSIFFTYSLPGIILTLVICAGFFFVLSMLGLTTKKNLLGMGTILLVGLIMLILVQVVLMFVAPSDTALRLVSAIGIALFAGLTIYDAQQTKMIFAAYESQGAEVIKKVSILCALNLYLDFVNLFLYILDLVGNRN